MDEEGSCCGAPAWAHWVTREELSDLEADGLAECQQIRSPESAASLGPSQGTSKAASPQGLQTPGALSPSTLAAPTEASRGEGTLCRAQLRSRGRAPL